MTNKCVTNAGGLTLAVAWLSVAEDSRTREQDSRTREPSKPEKYTKRASKPEKYTKRASAGSCWIVF
ncbi:hypothetical protein AB6D20_027570 (plasmid) [Vibrio splendidus]